MLRTIKKPKILLQQIMQDFKQTFSDFVLDFRFTGKTLLHLDAAPRTGYLVATG